MGRKSLKIFGWTVSFGFLSFIAIFFTFKAYSNLFEDWFSENALWIAIIGTIIIVILIIFGALKISAIQKKSKRFF